MARRWEVAFPETSDRDPQLSNEASDSPHPHPVTLAARGSPDAQEKETGSSAVGTPPSVQLLGSLGLAPSGRPMSVGRCSTVTVLP